MACFAAHFGMLPAGGSRCPWQRWGLSCFPIALWKHYVNCSRGCRNCKPSNLRNALLGFPRFGKWRRFMQESIVETLKNMKSEQNLTLQQISSASGVPLSTVNRILSGQTENPSFRDRRDRCRHGWLAGCDHRPTKVGERKRPVAGFQRDAAAAFHAELLCQSPGRHPSAVHAGA